MLFNQNIIAEILRSSFGNEIEEFVNDCVMDLEDYDLEDVFTETVDFAVLDCIDEIAVEDYRVEDEEDGRTVSGELGITAVLDGFETVGSENVFKDTGVTVFEAAFSFYAVGGKYSDIELEYLY